MRKDDTISSIGEQLERFSLGKKIAVIFFAVVVLFGIAACDSDADSGSNGKKHAAEAKKDSGKADAKKKADKKKYETKEPPNSKRAKRVKKVTKVLTDWSSEDEGGINCPKWEVLNEGTKSVAYVLSCEKSAILVASGDDKYDTGGWVDSMDKAMQKEGILYALVKKDVAVTSTDEGTINLIWDLLGASGKRETLGSAPFSD